MSILITGSTGFIGSHLVSSLRKKNYKISEYVGDIRNISKFVQKFDTVVHLASATGNIQMQRNRKDGFDINVIGTAEVLEYCNKMNASLIFASTCGVYGETTADSLLREDMELNPLGDYAMSKFLAEELCRRSQLTSQSKNCVVLRLFNVYGRGQRKGFLIPDILESVESGGKLKLRNPNAVRDFVYVNDCVNAIILSLNLKGFHILNISSAKAVSNIELVRVMESILNRPILVEVSSSNEHIGYSIGDNGLAANILNWHPTFDLYQGLSEILKYEK
ncbi:NAD-dependent epimerase/dehydratase family protein [Leptospira levettii]|uniref:NAD-dependent epimerase/dehydratase family protein n=1 Tax=Leptospira levettii TaxID=2023178 RepID=UPI0013FDECC3|nr:NAD(P)-dependent oxidoreductase [Leptospira levettii]MCW7472047.1 NAD(P)-dependent oxidoreductase [Leptospira levettii]